MPELDASYLQRAAAAHEAGVTCAIAVPVFLNGALTAVLVVPCGHVAKRPDALELWHADSRVPTDMTLDDGAYGTSAQAFETASRDTVLPRRQGMPSMARQRSAVRGRPVGVGAAFAIGVPTIPVVWGGSVVRGVVTLYL